MKTTLDSKKFVFLGNEEFGIPVISGLLEKFPDKFVAIYTSVKMENKFDFLSSKFNVPLHKVKHINEHLDDISGYQPTALIVCGWSQIIKPEFMQNFSCIGMHPTLLPKRRGRNPITWTLIDGLKESGVTVFFLADGVDDGDIIFQRKFQIEKQDTAMILINKVNKLLIEMFSDVIERFPEIPRKKQDEREATYKELRTEADDEIDLNLSIAEIDYFVRAHTPPYPYAYIKNSKGDKIYIKEISIEK